MNRPDQDHYQSPGSSSSLKGLILAKFVIETLSIAEVAERLQLENHFSFHEYDGDRPDGGMICPNGKLVRALLAGRDILNDKA